jgi:nucleoside-triphosphatase
MKIKNIFVTGSIHIGKTTILNKVLDKLPNLKISGFRTLPIYENKKKQGFIFESLEGSRKLFAHIDLNTENQFDVYKFDRRVFEEIGISTLKEALSKSDVILMDEIGMMEKQAKNFRQMIIKCLNSPHLVLGAFQDRATWFSKILKERVDTKIFVIREFNRDLIPDQIIELINQQLLNFRNKLDKF